MKRLLIILLISAVTLQAQAYTKADLFNSEVQITWLGLDFTHMRFIGTAAQWEKYGEITNGEIRDKYLPAWNDLLVNEKDKYLVPDAISRVEVQYAPEVVAKANATIKAGFFESNAASYQLLSESEVEKIVSKYDFHNHKGLGMLFIVEGMSKEKKETSAWVTFVDMGTKQVLLTKRVQGKAGGIGFRNFWGKSFDNILEKVKKDWSQWAVG